MRPLFIFLSTAIVVYADPIIIRSGINSHKDEARAQGAKIFDLSNSKGITDFEGERGFDRDTQSKHVAALDTGKYAQENALKNVHSNEKNFADDQFHQLAGGEEADYNKKSANKKGHHKSGYTKSIKKDESESTSSFYDDADDENNEFVHNSKKKAYGDAGQHSQRGLDLDDKRYAQDEGKKGYYNNAGNYDRDLANQRNYYGKKYYDNRENLGHRNSADHYDEDGRYAEEKYLKHHPYYEADPYYDLPPPKKTITIYEDPRYDGFEKYPPYDSDYIQLDLRRPPRDYDYRYYDRRPSYDYYY